MIAFNELMKEQDIVLKDSFKYCATKYIESKQNILSPSTIKGYDSILRTLPDDFLNNRIDKINQIDIQNLINDYSADHSPKTTRNVHGFISAVLRQYRPTMVISSTLPQKRKYEPYTPSEDDIKRILEASKSNPFYHVAFQLGVLGMRRSEICAATPEDIEGNILHINKALVSDKDNNWIVKSTKTTSSTRDIYLPDALVSEIMEQGYIYKGWANTLLLGLQDYQKKLGIPKFRFHDLRHFYASYCHSLGMSDADIIASGGWKSDYTMKRVYRHEMNVAEEQKRIASKIL